MQSLKHGYPSTASTGIHIPTQLTTSINKQNMASFYSTLREALICYQALPTMFISAHLYMDKYERKPDDKW